MKRQQWKLREATFFFELMRDEISRAFARAKNDPEVFLYYLSAFLSASRSVTFAAECEEGAKYKAWFPGWRNSRTEQERKILLFMNGQRAEEVHGGGAETTAAWELVPEPQSSFDNRYHPAYLMFLCTPPDAPTLKIGRTSYKFDLGGEEVDVIETCGRYLELLQRFVDDFMAAPEPEKEAEAQATITLRVPAALKTRIEQVAKKSHQSVNDWAMRCLEECASSPTE